MQISNDCGARKDKTVVELVNKIQQNKQTHLSNDNNEKQDILTLSNRHESIQQKFFRFISLAYVKRRYTRI